MTSEKIIKVLIVEDELLGRQRLEDLLVHNKSAEIVGFAKNGKEAVELIRSLHPDLVFLDVQMPSLTGVDVVREIGPEHMPATIFVTAYDHYALDAFEVAAVDYLVKPFDDERFDQSFERAQKMINLQKVDEITTKLIALLQEGETAPVGIPSKKGRQPDYLERIAVEMRGQVRVVQVDQIDFITASGPYAELHVGEATYVIREQMQSLEERLNPKKFFRIHRSAIIRLDLIDTFMKRAGGDYAVRLKDGRHLKVSRNRREALEKHLGLDAFK